MKSSGRFSKGLHKQFQQNGIDTAPRPLIATLNRGKPVLLSDMTKHDSQLDLIFQALSDPTRRAILAQLGKGPAAAGALARPTGLALPTVMRHLSVLEQADLITTKKSGRERLCQARPETLTHATDWLTEQRTFWEGRFDRLDAYVQTLMKENCDDN
jgi:DNA-binding transcriptional ArsR family regulator